MEDSGIDASGNSEEIEAVSELLQNDADVTFKSLGLKDVLCETCEELKWKTPSKIQQESIPVAIDGKDVIGLAETGSGKTGAFCLPILQVSHFVLTPDINVKRFLIYTISVSVHLFNNLGNHMLVG